MCSCSAALRHRQRAVRGGGARRHCLRANTASGIGDHADGGGRDQVGLPWRQPLYFRAVSVSIPPGQKISFSARPNGILYQLSGSTEVSAGEPKTITGGEGVITAGKTMASLTAGSGEQSILLYFLLVPQEALDQPVAATPATVNELYRTAAPLPELKPGSYEFNLTRVSFPPGMPSNPPHHRSGAALYYIVAGIGANTVDGKTEDRGPGSLIYEPFGLVHQWGNPGSEPLTFLAFNINPERVPAVVPETPAKP